MMDTPQTTKMIKNSDSPARKFHALSNRYMRRVTISLLLIFFHTLFWKNVAVAYTTCMTEADGRRTCIEVSKPTPQQLPPPTTSTTTATSPPANNPPPKKKGTETTK